MAADLMLGCLVAPSASGQIAESAGTVRLEAEAFSSSIPRTVDDPINGSVPYSWQPSAAIGGFSGQGLVQVLPNDGTSVTANWTTTAPELRYTINFSNAGTYYVWLGVMRRRRKTSPSLSV